MRCKGAPWRRSHLGLHAFVPTYCNSPAGRAGQRGLLNYSAAERRAWQIKPVLAPQLVLAAQRVLARTSP